LGSSLVKVFTHRIHRDPILEEANNKLFSFNRNNQWEDDLKKKSLKSLRFKTIKENLNLLEGIKDLLKTPTILQQKIKSKEDFEHD